MEKRLFHTHLTAHAHPAHGELGPCSHDDVRPAAIEAQISPLDAGGEGIAGTRTVVAGRHRSVFRIMLEFFIGGFAQCGGQITLRAISTITHRSAELGIRPLMPRFPTMTLSPERAESLRHTIPSQPSLQACRQTTSPSPARCWLIAKPGYSSLTGTYFVPRALAPMTGTGFACGR